MKTQAGRSLLINDVIDGTDSTSIWGSPLHSTPPTAASKDGAGRWGGVYNVHTPAAQHRRDRHHWQVRRQRHHSRTQKGQRRCWRGNRRADEKR